MGWVGPPGHPNPPSSCTHGPTASLQLGPLRADPITAPKHLSDCPAGRCTGPAVQMVAAVNGGSGYARGLDYRSEDVMGAYTYIPSLDIGVVMQVGALCVSPPRKRFLVLHPAWL